MKIRSAKSEYRVPVIFLFSRVDDVILSITFVGKTLKQQCGVEQTGDKEPTLNDSQRQLFSLLNMYRVM